MDGKLIVIEGLDGSGKATQAALIRQDLEREGLLVEQISFPDYGSDSSALVKMYLRGEFGSHADDVNAYAASSFYAVDRYASYKKGWKKTLDAGGIVIADRYTTSNTIYQCSKLPAERWDKFLDWLFHYEYELLGIPKADLTVYLHVEPEVSQELMNRRYDGDEAKKDIHEKDMEYIERSQKAARYCAKKLGWNVIECCNGKEMRSIGEIHEDIMAIARKCLDDCSDINNDFCFC
ncbi:MAG: deoxynucleoside kinase [Lachnospiraceae bacterium]|nr:deoxynucleoside kinase [Lachnospiraceae bacterium]